METMASSTAITHDAPVFFEAAGETLFGVVSEPTSTSAALGVVLVNGGAQVPSPGRSRIHTRLAHRLAAGGFRVLRFDYHGAGDSTGSVDAFRLNRPFIEDLSAGVAVLGLRGVDRYIFVGRCFGARTALATASTMPNVAGLVLIALPVRDQEKDEFGTRSLTPERSVWRYGRRALRPSVIRDLLRTDRRGGYMRMARVVWRSRRARSSVRNRRRSPLLMQIGAVVERRIPVLLLTGTEGRAAREFREAMSSEFGEAIEAPGSKVDVRTLQGDLGAFADVGTHEAVTGLIAAWIEGVHRVSESSPRRRLRTGAPASSATSRDPGDP